MKASDIPSILRNLALAFLIAGVTAACVPAYETRMDIRSPPGISVAEGTRLAALAFQDIGFWPKRQSESAGVVVAEHTEAITFGMEDMTITMQANIRPAAGNGVTADAKVTVSKNMAVYTEQQDWVDKFQEAFNQRLAQWRPVAAPYTPSAPPPVPRSRPAPVPMPAPAPPPSPGAREYDL